MKLEPQILHTSIALRAELGHMLVMFGAALLVVCAIAAAERLELASLRRAGLWLLALVAGAVALVVAALALADDAGACSARAFSGLASFYSNGESGARTANGSRFVDRELTAAHRCLPFGTRLRVSYLSRSGELRSVMVVVNDRGPAAWTGRAIDLSRGAALRLGMTRAGVVPVHVKILDGLVLE